MPALAAEYRADEFLGLDLSGAVLSPKRLGPPAQFAPVPIEAKTDRSGSADVRVEPKADHQTVVRAEKVIAPRAKPRPGVARAHPARAYSPAAARVAHVHPPARARLARRHPNPLDAQARDTRIQVWPCQSGGICDWK